MINPQVIGLTSLGLGALLSIPAVALGYWLQKTNRAPNRSVVSVLFCIGAVLLKLIWLKNLPCEIVVLFALLASTLGVYRTDIYRIDSTRGVREVSYLYVRSRQAFGIQAILRGG